MSTSDVQEDTIRVFHMYLLLGINSLGEGRGKRRVFTRLLTFELARVMDNQLQKCTISFRDRITHGECSRVATPTSAEGLQRQLYALQHESLRLSPWETSNTRLNK